MFRFHTIRMPSWFPDEDVNDLDVILGDEKDEEVDEKDEKDDDKDDKEGNEDDEDDELESKSDDDKDEEKEEDEDAKNDKRITSYSDVKAKFPEFWKEFPDLKAKFFREGEYTKRFPTVQDADEALESVEAFENVKEAVTKGDATEFLNQVKNVSDKAVVKFAESFLPALFEVNESAYYKITTPIIKNILYTINKAAEKSNNKNAANAAKVIHNEIFDNYDLGPVDFKSKSKEDDEEEDPEYSKEKREFYQGKQQALQGAVIGEIDKQLRKEVERGLDPTNSLRPGLKKILVDKIIAEVDAETTHDSSHMERMKSLWDRERRNKFTGRLKDSIITAYLSRAKASIPSIRKRIRADAIEAQTDEDIQRSDKIKNRSERVQPGSESKGSSKLISVKDARKDKLSDSDIIARS